jgi:hypothetical protein
MLILNKSGPWGMNYKKKGVTAINTSCHAATGEFLGFVLTMVGTFDRPEKHFLITASFLVTPDIYEVKTDADSIVFQRGY